MNVHEPDQGDKQRTRYLIILLFAILAVAIFTIGYFSYQNYEREHGLR